MFVRRQVLHMVIFRPNHPVIAIKSLVSVQVESLSSNQVVVC